MNKIVKTKKYFFLPISQVNEKYKYIISNVQIIFKINIFYFIIGSCVIYKLA